MSQHDQRDAAERFAAHVTDTTYDDLPDEAIAAAKVFLLDSFGVALAGSTGPWVSELTSAFAGDGGAQARVWGHRDCQLPAHGAAVLNAYQIHNSEFDCVHEAAVVHPMATLLGALGTHLDRVDGPVSGREFVLATVLGVDVAAGLGVAARSPLRFFRPGTAGGFAATAALGRVMQLDRVQLSHAFGLVYAQMCGTMQAHTEGLSLLAMQVGFNARNALFATQLAAAGIPATQQTLQGDYGYFGLFEPDYDIEPVLESLGSTWRITEVAHKPFPSGRATHGIVDACLTLSERHDFGAADVASVHARVPPLTYRLVSRPVRDDMSANYGRLCAAYVAARAMSAGSVGLEDFETDALRDKSVLSLAARVHIERDDNPDPNALTPLTVSIELNNGQRVDEQVSAVYGNPARPMTRDAQLDKFRRNWAASAGRLDAQACEDFIQAIEQLPQLDDARCLIDLLTHASH